MNIKTKSALVVLALSGAATVLWLLGGRALVAEGLYPVERSASWFSRHVTCRLRTLWRRQNYAAEVQRLRRENDVLKMTLADLNRASATPVANMSRNWIPANILSHGGAEGAAGFLRLDRGSADGITEQAAVAVPEGLVGRITAVTPHTSIVTFITDPAVRVACEVESDDPGFGTVFGIVSGSGTRRLTETDATVLYFVDPLKVRHLKRDLVLPARTRLVTSGLGGVFPRGLVVGWIAGEPVRDASGLECTADVRPAVDFPALERVFVRRP